MSIKKTVAFKKIEAYRDSMNQGRTKIECKLLSCVVYFYSVSGKFCAVGYRGRSKKPAFRYFYRTSEYRQEMTAAWMKARHDAVANRTKKASEPRLLAVGDVLRNSWGYEQTNIDYYLVTKLIGKTYVEIVEIGQHRTYEGMQGNCTPDPSKIIGEPMRKKAQGDYVSLSTGSARKIEHKVVAGCKIYAADYYTSYH